VTLENRTVVVTGGSAGIGLGAARVLGLAGARLALWSRRPEVAERAVDALRIEKIDVIGVACDVGLEPDVERAMQQTLDVYGRVDALVANAGGSTSRRPVWELTLAEWDLVVRTNLTGTFLSLRAAARQMLAQGDGGALVAIGSIAAFHGQPELAHYAAAKAGLGGLVRTMAVELAPSRIRCNILAPGFTANSRGNADNVAPKAKLVSEAAIPAGRWGTPEDIGAALCYLADPDHWYQTGATLCVDGGLSIMPPQGAARAALEADS
jgi:NAD(P)-dependent dehydrogenase (short-subunit alcohol dehydrogenase family)